LLIVRLMESVGHKKGRREGDIAAAFPPLRKRVS